MKVLLPPISFSEEEVNAMRYTGHQDGLDESKRQE